MLSGLIVPVGEHDGDKLEACRPSQAGSLTSKDISCLDLLGERTLPKTA